MKEAGMSLTHDVAVPITMVPDYIATTEKELRRRFPDAIGAVVCHLGDGNVHYNVTFPRQVWDGVDDKPGTIEEIRHLVQKTAVDQGGTFVAEHGIGRKNRAAAAEFKSPVEREIVAALRAALDPKGLMNPDTGVPA